MESATATREASGGPARDLYAQSLARAFLTTVDRRTDTPAIVDQLRDVTLTWGEVRDRVGRIAGGLASIGVAKGDTVAMMMGGRPDFIPCDMAVVALGGVPFSIYETSSPEQIQYVVSDAEAKVALVEEQFLDRILAVKGDLPALERIYVVDSDSPAEGAEALADLEGADSDFDLEAAVDEVQSDDLLTLIYTSGTTGPPKGVQLTHANLMSLVAGVDDVLPFPDEGGDVISWLPAAHIAERGANYYLPVIMGLTINICPDPRKIIEVLPQVRPIWFFAVPRIWEKLKGGLEAMVQGMPDEQREPAEKALGAALKKVKLEQTGEPVPEELAAGVADADEKMFAGIRQNLGLDKAVALSVGAAPTPIEVLEFFHSIGLPIGELWGMSETCGVVTMNPPDKVKLGTVGVPMAGMDVKLAEDGEILVKGPSIMTGYRNMPDKTEETIDSDGWLCTGDIGELDSEGYLKIVDRKKELIINAAGKNMSPANIESHIKSASPLIGQAVAIGDRRPYNVALITLDPEVAPVWAKKNGVEGESVAEIAEDEKTIEAIQAAIDEGNEHMARIEQIKKFKLLPEEWQPGGDELTPTMKLKRKPIDEKYGAEIEELYAG